jgi:hypothetical protein
MIDAQYEEAEIHSMWHIYVVVYLVKETNQRNDWWFCRVVIEQLIGIMLFVMDFNMLVVALNVIPKIIRCAIYVCFVVVLTIIFNF